MNAVAVGDFLDGDATQRGENHSEITLSEGLGQVHPSGNRPRLSVGAKCGSNLKLRRSIFFINQMIMKRCH